MATHPITTLKGVGESSAKLLKKLRIETVEDLIYYVPRRYEDYSNVIPVSQARPGLVTFQVTFRSVKKRYSRQGLHITEAIASDATGSVAVTWFNQPYRAESLRTDAEYYVSGEFATSHRHINLVNPSIELVSSFPVHTARLVPQYRLTKGLGGVQIRKFIKQALLTTSVDELIPSWIAKDYSLMPRKDAFFQIHFPTSNDELTQAQRRLGFEEIFEMSLASELNKQQFAENKGIRLPFDEKRIKEYVQSLPFQLTSAQRASAWQILQDLDRPVPMNRLLEGDVGSGKTVVASIALVQTAYLGYQTAFMAPTEILARQHMISLKKLLPASLSDGVVLLVGGLSKKQKELTRSQIEQGIVHTVVGTHALFTDASKFKQLGLVIVDEQHRFGVEQRKALQAKASIMPHVLHMTATPIPRSLALTLYGELDISVIDSKPAGRQPVRTDIFQPEQRDKVYHQIREAVSSGMQAFVVCPKIETVESIRRDVSLETIERELKTSYLKGLRIAVLHGKMKSSEKEHIMADFLGKQYDVLLSTTVIEVGVDVPNATHMVIEGADQFGLAQLHQLRGRVGRGEHAGQCLLVLADNGAVSKRLTILSSEHDGFKLADYDLDLRGPGAIYGTMQHGSLDLRIARLSDVALISDARKAAQLCIKKGENLVHYTELFERVQRLRSITNLN